MGTNEQAYRGHAPVSRFNQVELLSVSDEDVAVSAQANLYFIRFDAHGWLDLENAAKLRDWLNHVLP